MKEKWNLNTVNKLRKELETRGDRIVGLHGVFKMKGNDNIMLGVQGELQINKHLMSYSKLGYGKILTEEDSII